MTSVKDVDPESDLSALADEVEMESLATTYVRVVHGESNLGMEADAFAPFKVATKYRTPCCCAFFGLQLM